MRKRIILSASAFAALLVLGYFSTHLYWLGRGVLGGEAFYAGKPTSYWRGIAMEAADVEVCLSDSVFITYVGSVPPPIATNSYALVGTLEPDVEPTLDLAPDLDDPPVDLNSTIIWSSLASYSYPPAPTWREKYGEWLPAWLDRTAATAWRDLCNDPDAIPVLRELFHDDDNAIRAKAAMALCSHGKAVSGDLPELLDYMRNGSDEAAKRAIAKKLAEIGGEDLLPMLCAWLNEEDPLAAHASTALLEYGRRLEKAIPQLIENLAREHGDRSVRLLASAGEKALPAVKKELTSKNAATRRNATDAYGRLTIGGKLDKRVAAAILKERLKDADPGVRCAAVAPLGRLDLTAALRTYNDDLDAKVQSAALVSICSRGRYPAANVSFHAPSCFRQCLKIAEKRNDDDLHYETARAWEKYIRSKCVDGLKKGS